MPYNCSATAWLAALVGKQLLHVIELLDCLARVRMSQAENSSTRRDVDAEDRLGLGHIGS